MAKVNWFPGHMPDEVLNRQAKMVQAEIRHLRRKIRELETDQAMLLSDVEEADSNIKIDEYRATERFLPMDTFVTFDLAAKGGWSWDKLLHCRVDSQEESLQIQGARGLIIKARSSNLLYIKNEER